MEKTSKKQIIGITGAFGSGKSTAASYLQSKGFRKISLSSYLEKEARQRGVAKVTRKILQDIGNEWRKKYGSGVLARKALESADVKWTEKIVIDGLRNPGEVEELRKNIGFSLLGIVSDRTVRFERLNNLGRREKLTPELFEKLDRRDLGRGQKQAGLRVAECIAMSDYFIENNDTMKKFKEKLNKFLLNI